MKRFVRRFAVWLYHTTNYWVVSKEVHEAIACNKHFPRFWAGLVLEKAAEDWPDDPEVTRTQTLLHFLDGED